MNLDISTATVFNGAITGILSIVAFMLRGIYTDFRAATAKISDHEIRIAILAEKVKTLEQRT